jgi:cytochrome P450
MDTYGAEMRTLARDYVRRLARPYLLDAVLPLDVKSPHDYARRRFSERWMGLLDRMIASRLAAPATATPCDLLDLLREARDPESGQGFSREQLRDQVATMLVAGHETTSVAVFWSLYLLASVPFAQECLAQEARDRDLSPEHAADALANLPYTRAVVSEALRLYPPAFMVVREAIGPDRCGTVEVRKGDTVLIAPWVLGRHRRYWYDPHAFDPGRFMPGAPPPSRFAYLPFGAGPRVCIGAQFAMAMALIVVAGLVQRFRLSLVDAAPVLPVCVITTRPARPPMFRLTPR